MQPFHVTDASLELALLSLRDIDLLSNAMIDLPASEDDYLLKGYR